ncbi:hypothetical protein JTB14_002231 [Gonioctena quinquepunctata]|nr:hypothetical protein JTB14_002231 [Gonioctena quinquepunctata]
MHQNQKEFKCTECDVAFTRITYLKKHAKSHGTSDGNSDAINMPKKRKSRASYLKKYNFRVKVPNGPITCKHCLKSLKNIECYKQHLETHLLLYRFKCRYCDKSYTSSGNKRIHEKMHKKPNYGFRCNECYKTFTTQEELDTHAVRHASTPKRYQCGECFELFSREYQLRSHIVDVHVEQGDVNEARYEIIADALREFAV